MSQIQEDVTRAEAGDPSSAQRVREWADTILGATSQGVDIWSQITGRGGGGNGGAPGNGGGTGSPTRTNNTWLWVAVAAILAFVFIVIWKGKK